MIVRNACRAHLFPAACLFAFALSTRGGVDDLRITEVNPFTSEVEVTNFGTDSFTTPTGMRFCYRFTYPTLPQTAFGPGTSVTFSLTGLGGLAMNTGVSDIWLYRDSSFGSSSSIISGIKYGSDTQVGRENVAVGAGIWPASSAFIPAPSAGQALQLRTFDPTDPAGWSSESPDFGDYFGTGDAFGSPIPNIPKSPVTVGLQQIATGFNSPLGLRQPDDGSGRLFIFDQVGTVHIVEDGALLATPFLDRSTQIVSLSGGFDERGLLGLAFHPDFSNNGKLYTYTSEPSGGGTADFFAPGSTLNHHTVITEWCVDTNNQNMVDAGTRRVLMRIEQPQSNHNGGDIFFGSGTDLFICIGDGGSANDNAGGHSSQGNGQDPGNVLGSILRIDVDGTNSLNGAYGIPDNNPFLTDGSIPNETFAYGFRNPYRGSYDALTGDIYTGDVGQGQIEEVDIVVGGGNYGWRLKEGSYFFDSNRNPDLVTIPVAPLPPLVDPIAEYDHGDGISVIGGYIYRGTKLPELAGRYVFGEYNSGSGRLFFLDDFNAIKEFTIGLNNRSLGTRVRGFGQDREGEIYVTVAPQGGPFGSSGMVYKIIPLLDLDGVLASDTEVEVDLIADDSITAPVVEGNPDLANQSGWTNKPGATFQSTGPNRMKATLPAPSTPHESYRATHP